MRLYTHPLGTKDIEGIFLDASNMLFDVKPAAFKHMLNLRFLKIYCPSYENLCGLCLPKGLESLPNELRLLHWENYPLESLPQDFEPDNLVELNLSYSQLHKLWRGSKVSKLPSSIGNATNLKTLCLTGCSSLLELPFSIGNATNLQKLNLEFCSSLVELPSSIGFATNLRELYLTGCSSLLELPSSIGNAINLKILDLGDCSSLGELPLYIGNAINLEELNLEYCSSLLELPSTIGYATNLKKLCLAGCSSLVELPSSIVNATNLQQLNLEYCSSLVELPSSFWNTINLKKLYVTGCSDLVELPSYIKNSTSFVSINLDEDDNVPIVTFIDNERSRCMEVRGAKRGNFFILKGEQNDEHYVSLILRIVDENGRVKNVHFLFSKEADTASKVLSEMVEPLKLPDQNITLIAEMIDVVLDYMIPDARVNCLWQLNQNSRSHQNEAKTQGEEETAFHDAGESVSHSCTSDVPRPDEQDKQCVEAIEVEYGRPNQEAEEATELVRLEEEEKLRQELEEIEAKYQEELKEIARKRNEAIMETKKKFSD